jgi:tRNA threonylcarbamoyladenosine modification (KEOPS) complex  Pcc1 subunit
MRYSLKLKVEETEGLYEVLAADEIINTGRAETKFLKDKTGITATVVARDAVALKASFGSIIKALEVYEKAEKVTR